MVIFQELLEIFKKAAGVDHKRPIFEDSPRGILLYDDAKCS